MKRINRIIKYGKTKHEEHYKRKWLGHIRFHGSLFKVNANYGCFITINSYEKLPENLRVFEQKKLISLHCKKIRNGHLMS